MAKSLSKDLRERVIAAVESGMSRHAAAERFGVSAASAVRWVRSWRESGVSSAARQGGDRRSRAIEGFGKAIHAAVDADKDITLVEIAALLREVYGVSFAPSTIWRFLDRHAMTFKKNGARSRAGSVAPSRSPGIGQV
ncbi:MAG: transposase [Hyphomonadaceae bacterium]|nr:MAG: ISSpo6 transposase orf A [Caulobacteraceae bacterium]MBT9445834.1 transposase [Hyphomonadaceae bacterium]TPW05052.1 MAG: ISSpo6, transposase orf A [Alphaproteobacteria bacterium]